MADNDLTITITEDEARELLRFVPLIGINVSLFPEKYKGDYKLELLKSVFEKVDYQIHEVKKLCKNPECPYWKVKEAKEKQMEKQN